MNKRHERLDQLPTPGTPAEGVLGPIGRTSEVGSLGAHRVYRAYRVSGFGLSLGHTWTPKVCRIMAFSRFWAIIFLTFGGLGI